MSTTANSLQPIKVWGKAGPNPPKVAIVLAELGLPHEIQALDVSQLKTPEFLSINPNGRMPAIHDPNTGLTLWESGAIVEYLVEQYDGEHRLGFPRGTPEYFLAKQWLFFQTSGQGPYYGQAVWFKKRHPERVPSAQARYVAEMRRVTGVLEAWLAKQREEGRKRGEEKTDGPWLVGNRLSYADVAFVPWQMAAAGIIDKEDGYDVDEFPEVKAWLGRMMEREAVSGVVKSIWP